MKRLCLLLSIIPMMLTLFGQEYIECYNFASDEYVGGNSDLKMIREINGGTVVIPQFDETCTLAMQGAFEYACKIIEEYIPPCLPIYVKVTCGQIRSSSGPVLSKVDMLTCENFGKGYSKNYPMTGIKGVILGERRYGSSVTFLDSIPDKDFLFQNADITIKYNIDLIDDFSFSLDSAPEDKYDCCIAGSCKRSRIY